MVRTEQGPLRRLWATLHGLALWAIKRLLLALAPGASVYLRGSFAAGEPVYGFSDLDLVVVAPDAGGATRRRLDRLPNLEPPIAVKAYEEAELVDTAQATLLTYGLDRPDPPALFHGATRHYFLRTRPNLYGATADWRRVAGPERRPAVPAPDGPARLQVAWLELQCWWRYVAWTCLHPDDRGVPYFCFKFVAEAARIWLWVVHDERADGRVDALRRGLRRMPADEAMLSAALAARRRLGQGPGWLELGTVVPWLVDFSGRLAAVMSERTERASATEVRLAWSRRARRRGELPLADWRAIVVEQSPDDTFSIEESSPRDPTAVGRAAGAEAAGARVALRAPGVLVRPSSDLETRPMTRGTLRAIQCAATDPVSFALADGRTVARFPEVPGWSARDWARRAVAEHGAALRAAPSPGRPALLAAARAALFLRSLDRDDPELALGSADVAATLGVDPEADGAQLATAVHALPAFAGAARRFTAPGRG